MQEAIDRIWPDGIVEMSLDPDKKNFREVYGARACKTIVSLRAKTAGILEGFGIAVLPAEEWQKPPPWLRGTEETLIGLDGKRSAYWTRSFSRACERMPVISPVPDYRLW